MLCEEVGLAGVGHIALDGTKVAANASKHKAMSYKRMKTEEARLTKEIAEINAQAQATDRQEDEKFGKDKTGGELPTELQRRETRLLKIQGEKTLTEEYRWMMLRYRNPGVSSLARLACLYPKQLASMRVYSRLTIISK